MKICFFTTGVFAVSNENIKAIEHWTYNLAGALQKLGHEIVIFGAGTSSSEFEIIAPDKAVTVKEALDNPVLYDKYLEKYFLKCLNYSASNDVDIIHDQTSVLPVLNNIEFSKIPVVSTFHVIRDNPKYQDAYSRLNYLHNVAPSKYLVQASAPLRFEAVIPHGIDISTFAFTKRPKDKFIFVGKIIETKGPLIAAYAAAKIDKRLEICGDKMLSKKNENYYKMFISKIKDDENIKYLGKLPNDNIAKLIGESKSLLMPFSEPEAFGLVMAEALSCGTPVIAFDIGTAREIVDDGITGFLIKPGDIEGMAEAMKKIKYIDRKKCREIAESRFSHDTMVKRYLERYMEIKKNDAKN